LSTRKRVSEGTSAAGEAAEAAPLLCVGLNSLGRARVDPHRPRLF